MIGRNLKVSVHDVADMDTLKTRYTSEQEKTQEQQVQPQVTKPVYIKPEVHRENDDEIGWVEVAILALVILAGLASCLMVFMFT